MAILLILPVFAPVFAACTVGSEPVRPEPTHDLGATVQAAVAAALPTEAPPRMPDPDATSAADVAATEAPTLAPMPTPDIDATVEARMAATIAAMPTGAPTAVPEAEPTVVIPTTVLADGATPAIPPSPAPTPTPIPTATPAPTSAPVGDRMPLTDMVKLVRPAVVRIATRSSVGSGVIYETTGQTAFVVTNEHVTAGSNRVSVVVNDRDTYTGTVLGTDAVRDLAVVSICCAKFESLPFGDSASLEPGDEVIAIGYALGLSGQASITRGIVSAIRYDSGHLSDVIQTDAAINPGNSGGPMLSMSGEILGINTFRIEQTSSGRTAQGLGFAVSETTVRDQIPHLRSAAASPTPTPQDVPSSVPTPGPTSTPRPGPEEDEGNVFGPVSGALRHDPQDGRLEAFRAGVSMTDVAVSATFVNPASSGSRSWDYGFSIREAGGASVRAIVTSAGRWQVAVAAGGSSPETTEGPLQVFNGGVGQLNSIVLFATGNWGMLFVNGEFVSPIDLSAVGRVGDVAVITGANPGNEISGVSTRFERFQAIQLQKRFGPTGGSLPAGASRITEYNTGLWTRDLVAEAEFVSPVGGNWDYGFVFRNPAFNVLEVVGVSDEGKWFHTARSATSGGYVDLAKGAVSESGAAFRDRNHVMLVAFGSTGLLLLNGQMVARLDLLHNQNSGGVSAVANFYFGNQGSPSFTNFNVWTP